VHVCVDEARDDEAAVSVENLASLVVAEPGDPAVDDRDVDVEPLPGEDGQDAAAADDEIRRLVTARDRKASGEIDGHACANPLMAAEYAWRRGRPHSADARRR